MILNIDNSAITRISELRKIKGKDSLMLRVRVEGGGCSGFKYKLELTDDIDATKDSDIIFASTVISDKISMDFLDGATISFEKNLVGSEFKINNPNAASGCGCGTSFSI